MQRDYERHEIATPARGTREAQKQQAVTDDIVGEGSAGSRERGRQPDRRELDRATETQDLASCVEEGSRMTLAGGTELAPRLMRR